jgi:hypothetical protein
MPHMTREFPASQAALRRLVNDRVGWPGGAAVDDVVNDTRLVPSTATSTLAAAATIANDGRGDGDLIPGDGNTVVDCLAILVSGDVDRLRFSLGDGGCDDAQHHPRDKSGARRTPHKRTIHDSSFLIASV